MPRILLLPDECPHWLALEPDGNRFVSPGRGALNTKLCFATIDRRPGNLSLEPATIDFARLAGGLGRGRAMSHGAVFSNP